MSFLTIIIHIVLAVVLFFLVNWIGEKTKPMDFGYVQISLTLQDDTAPLFNYLFKVLAPVIYVILLLAIFQNTGCKEIICDRIYWIVIDYWIFRFLFLLVKGQASFLNWPLQIIYWISSIGVTLWVYSVCKDAQTILPDPKELLEELWILIILFLYSILNKINYSRKGAEKRIQRYIIRKYQRFTKSYDSIIGSSFDMDFLKVLTYSIMIYEDFNRPYVFRFMERSILGKTKRPHTYGVMQVMSSKPLADEDSVIEAINLIKDYASQLLSDHYEENKEIDPYYYSSELVAKYNPGDYNYSDQVMSIYSFIYGYLNIDIHKRIKTSIVFKALSK